MLIIILILNLIISALVAASFRRTSIKQHYFFIGAYIFFVIMFILIPFLREIVGVDSAADIGSWVSARAVTPDVRLWNYGWITACHVMLLVGYVGGGVTGRLPERTQGDGDAPVEDSADTPQQEVTPGLQPLHKAARAMALLGMFGSVGLLFMISANPLALLTMVRYSYLDLTNVTSSWELLPFDYLSFCTLVGAFLWTYKFPRDWFLAISALTCIFSNLVFLGSRSTPMAVIAAVFVGMLFRRDMRLDLRNMLLAGAGVMLIIHTAATWQTIRYHNYELSAVQLAEEYFSLNSYSYSFSEGELAYCTDTVSYCFMLFPQYHDWLYGATYTRLILLPFPRTLIGDLKPDDTEHVFAEITNPEAAAIGGTIPPTLPGDLYINFGVFGAFGFALLGTLFRSLGRRMRAPTESPALLALVASYPYSVMLVGRGAVFNGSVILISNIFLLIVLQRFFGSERRTVGNASVPLFPDEPASPVPTRVV